MPIRPIDLQTLLMQLHQVGREQSAEKEGVALQASIQGATAQRKATETKESVRRSEDPKEGPNAVKDRNEGAPSGSEGEAGEGGDEESGERREEIVRDPNLGTKVDISG